MLIDRGNWPQHRTWALGFLVATILASLWYFAASVGEAARPGGSSPPGFTFGVLGGLIIVFESLLWVRKQLRVRRLGRAQTWLRAHIWLGLLSVPLVILHSGFRLGGSFSTVLMLLFLAVIASGIGGLALQHWLPRRLLEHVPLETVPNQIEILSGQLISEADQLIRATCGPAPGEEAKPSATVVAGTESLRAFYLGNVEPYLRCAAGLDSPLRLQDRAAGLFEDVKTTLPSAAYPAVDRLWEYCNQRRQWDEQDRIHFWLHSWLWVHLQLSLALLLVLVVHVWVAIKYW